MTTDNRSPEQKIIDDATILWENQTSHHDLCIAAVTAICALEKTFWNDSDNVSVDEVTSAIQAIRDVESYVVTAVGRMRKFVTDPPPTHP